MISYFSVSYLSGKPSTTEHLAPGGQRFTSSVVFPLPDPPMRYTPDSEVQDARFPVCWIIQ